MLAVESKKVREETNAVSGTRVVIVKKKTPKAAPSAEPPTPRGRSSSRIRSLRGSSPSGKTNRQPSKNVFKGTCTKLPCDYEHLPERQFYKSETGCKFGPECSFPHWKVEDNPTRRSKKCGDKSAVATVKDVRQFGCVSQDAEPAGIFSDFELRCVKQTSEKAKVYC